MNPDASLTLSQVGLLGASLIIMYRMVGVLAALVSKKAGLTAPGATQILPCQLDPIHHQRIKDIHEYTEGVQMQIARGEFKCAWQGRDEVLHMINLQERMLEAMAANTTAITALTDQLRRSNG